MVRLKSLDVYERLKEKFISLEFTPGQRINIREISRELEISDIPIREALKMLEIEGFIEFEKNKGAKVKEFNSQDFEMLIRFRIELEAVAARWATKYVTEDDILFLRKRIDNMDFNIKMGNVIEYEKENSIFHQYLYNLCGSPILLESLNNLFAQTFYTKSYFTLFPGNLEKSNEEHKAIIKCLEVKDAQGVEACIREQKESSIKVILEKFKENEGVRK